METLKELTRHLVLDHTQMKEFCKDPLIISDADGIHYTDVDGKSYIDGYSGVFAVNVGHGNRAIIEAMIEQINRLTFNPPLQSTNPKAIELAKLIVDVTPAGLNTVKLFSGGSEATEAAIKMARQYHLQSGHPRKHKIISRYLSYHGATLGAMSATGVASFKTPFEPLGSGFMHVPPPYCYRCPFGQTYPDCGMICARLIEQVIQWEGPESVAAIIVDPVMVSGGILVAPREYFSILREICDRHNVLLIFDEVITGFGRLGKMFAADLYDVTPDIMALGKGISSGYAPVAAIAIADRVAEKFWGEPEEHREFHHGHTYGGHPVTSAAAVANIREVLRLDLPGNADRMGKYLLRRLQRLHEFPIVGDIRGQGLLVGIELVTDKASKAPFPDAISPAKKVQEVAKDNGLLVSGAIGHVIRLAPPLIVTQSDIDDICSILEFSLAEVQAALL